jgi:coenzyme F420-dependent glucose-6-phosphate dehydrogenase
MLLSFALKASQEGFDFMPVSDHFHPWFHTGASACFAWSWVTAAAATVPKIRLGPMVAAPIGRYHPAIIAQAFATMDEMYPGRFFLGMGTGEAMNEVPLGYPWPPFSERLGRLREAVEIIRALWGGEFVDYPGSYYKLKGAKLYTKPKTKIPIYLVANGPKAASLVGSHADGYGTLDLVLEKSKEIWAAVETSARSVGRDPSTISRNIELYVSYNRDYGKALASTRKWKSGLIHNAFSLPVYDPRELERLGENESDSELAKTWTIATSAEQLIKKAESAIAYGFNEVQFHSSSPSEEEFIEVCGRDVLPYLKSTYRGL